MASIRDVARAAGVSPATVSRTFTTPDLINAQTQQRVLEVARQLNYRPPRLRKHRIGTEVKSGNGRPSGSSSVHDAIGFQFFTATSAPFDTIAANLFYATVFAGAQAEASSLGLHLLVHTTNRHVMAREIPKMIRDQAIGGMLLVGTADPEVLETFAGHVPNIILVDNRDETGKYECVLSDGFHGAYTATRYLLELGHRRIGFYLSEAGVPTFQDRLHGYLSALFEAGIRPDFDMVFGRAPSIEEGRPEVARVLASSTRPTAIISSNDAAAHSVLRLAREVGLKVPEDLSLIGFDDIELSSHSDPTLTTIRVDKEAMGRLAVRILQARLHRQDGGSVSSTPVSVQHLIPVHLIIRESCSTARF